MLTATLALPLVLGLNNGLGKTPPMGYNAYDHVGCCANEQTMKDQADAIIRYGLDKLGYVYVNMDCGWIGGRHPNGTLFESAAKFPNGMKALADYMHERGLKLGVYSDRGKNDFSGAGLGMKGHETEDAAVMASWGVDYLKVDDMSGSPHTRAGAFADYAKIRDALNATGRPIFFSTCAHSPSRNAKDGSGGPSWMGEDCAELANACRIASDVRYWGPGEFGTFKALNVMSFAGAFSQAGAWADPDMLFSFRRVGDPAVPMAACPADGAGRLQYCTGSFCDPHAESSRSTYALWAVMGAPLLLSFDLRNLTAAQLDIVANEEVIAVNQDAAALPAMRADAAGGNLTDWTSSSALSSPPLLSSSSPSTVNVWARPLHDGALAVAFLNAGTAPADVRCDATCFQAILAHAARHISKGGLAASAPLTNFTVRDLWQKKDIGVCSDCANMGYSVIGLPSNSTKLLKFTGL